MPWISKKAKAQIRARRKKKEKSSESSKETKLDQENAEPSKNWDVIHKNVVSTITIPSTATSKEARKIRKEARRAARKEGRDESLIKFVDENGHSLSTSDDKNASNDDVDCNQEDAAEKEPPRKKRKKSSFPSINKLLEEAEAAKRAQKEKEKQEAYEKSIPDEVKKSHVALDCEMVGIGIDGKQSALARVSITGWDNEILLDTFVQVPDRVTDFRTHVSGVRAKDIKFTNENAMELHACRKKVAEIIKNKILIGHSLKNDFAALMLDHPKLQIRDTARYNHS
jgi:Exonuclease.